MSSLSICSPFILYGSFFYPLVLARLSKQNIEGYNLLLIREITKEDRENITSLLHEHWGSPRIISKGIVYEADMLDGLIIMEGDTICGFLTYFINSDGMEIITFNSLVENTGIGTALLHGIMKKAIDLDVKKISLITTNDNLNALRFYQKNGFRITSYYKGAIKNSRKLKPSIPLIGNDGIPIEDEIELEYNV